jgi:uncharacterized membrane protein
LRYRAPGEAWSYYSSNVAPLVVRKVVVLHKKKRSFGVINSFFAVRGGIAFLMLAAYVVDDALGCRGYLLAVSWILTCLTLLFGATRWIKSRRSRVR